MTEDCVRKGKITHLEMHGADESNLSLRRCTMITLQSIIYKVSRSPAHTLYAQGKTPDARLLSLRDLQCSQVQERGPKLPT